LKCLAKASALVEGGALDDKKKIFVTTGEKEMGGEEEEKEKEKEEGEEEGEDHSSSSFSEPPPAPHKHFLHTYQKPVYAHKLDSLIDLIRCG